MSEKNPQSDVKNLHRGVKNLHTRGLDSSHRSEKDTLERNLTVNGDKTTESSVKQLPELGHPEDKVELIVADVLEQLGDRQSEAFYRLVARRVPEHVIYGALSEIRADGAREPAKVFTYRMNRYGYDRLNGGE